MIADAFPHELRTVRSTRQIPILRLTGTALLALVALAWMQGIVVAQDASRPRGGYSVEDRLQQFGESARGRLAPHFEAAGLPYPGRRVALLAFKDSDRLELQAQNAAGQWRRVRDYPVLAASGRLGPKLREGDLQVPEGFYRVVFLNANSRFHVSLRLDYPNAFDREMGRADGRDRLGGDIMIHGKQASIGCLAMGDEVAEELFALAATIGASNMEVLIAPTDFRLPEDRRTASVPEEPAWIAGLYERLEASLRRFPP